MMKFRIVIQHVEEAVERVTNFVKDFDIVVYDVRESSIIDNKTEEKIGDVYVLCCQGSAYNFIQLRDKHFTTEIKYEGFRTIM